MEEFIISELLEGRPEFTKTIKEKECFDTLDAMDIVYQRVEYNYFPKDRDALELIDKVLGVPGIKNLMFTTKNKSQFFFIIIPRDERFDEKAFRSKFELPKITMAKNEDLDNVLKTRAGAVSIMDLIYDEENLIKLFIDKKVLDEEFFRFHPNENTSTVRVKTVDLLEKIIPYLNHEVNII